MSYGHWGAVCAVVVLLGCSAGGPPPGEALDSVLMKAESAPAAASEDEQAVEKGAVAQQKIIYRATLVLDVQDFSATEKQVAAALQKYGGYVAEFREDRQSGQQRGGRWLVRVPTEQFRPFLDAAASWGVAQRREVQAEDVGEEFVDLTARLKNKQQLESRLLELVAERTDAVKDVIAMEAELSRVREEIERIQGRLRYLSDRIALTTIDITAYERREYQPPQAPTFPQRVAGTFFQSIEMLQNFGEMCVISLVAMAPWLLALLVLVTPLVWLGRRRAVVPDPAQR